MGWTGTRGPKSAAPARRTSSRSDWSFISRRPRTWWNGATPYHCYCSPQRLQEMRQEQARRKQPTGYDRLCRDLAPGEAQDANHVVRFKMPTEGETTFHDVIRGDVTFANATVDDFVILKSDGYPTYHLASIVDDHLMDISM